MSPLCRVTQIPFFVFSFFFICAVALSFSPAALLGMVKGFSTVGCFGPRNAGSFSLRVWYTYFYRNWHIGCTECSSLASWLKNKTKFLDIFPSCQGPNSLPMRDEWIHEYICGFMIVTLVLYRMNSQECIHSNTHHDGGLLHWKGFNQLHTWIVPIHIKSCQLCDGHCVHRWVGC